MFRFQTTILPVQLHLKRRRKQRENWHDIGQPLLLIMCWLNELCKHIISFLFHDYKNEHIFKNNYILVAIGTREGHQYSNIQNSSRCSNNHYKHLECFIQLMNKNVHNDIPIIYSIGEWYSWYQFVSSNTKLPLALLLNIPATAARLSSLVSWT